MVEIPMVDMAKQTTANMKRIILVACAFLSLAFGSLTPKTFLNQEDKNRLKGLFKLTGPYDISNLVNIHYSLVGTAILFNDNLNAAITSAEKSELCTFIKDAVVKADSLENVYSGTSSLKLLNCQISPSTKMTAFLESALKEGSNVGDIFRASNSILNMGKPLDSAKISKLLQAALKKDESLLSVGLAFQLASKLKGKESMAPFVDKIGDIIVQADEVDGRNLQFEGGLGITANVINGIYALATAATKPTGLNSDQVLKFTNYFLSRKSVQTVKGAAELLETLKLFTNNKFHVPTCAVLYGSSAISPSNPTVTVQLTNTLGKSLGTGLVVTAESPTWTGKKAFTPVQGDSTMFALNFLENKPKRGPYTVTISAAPAKTDPRLIGNSAATIKVIVLTELSVDNAEVGIGDRDQMAAVKMINLQFPQFLKNEILEADHQQKVSMKFQLTDKSAGDTMTAHQVFVQFMNEDTKQEIIFVSEPNTVTGKGVTYKFDMNLATRAKDFGYASGTYLMSLIVGDSVIANSFVWKIASVKLSFPPGPEVAEKDKAPWMVANRAPKPEIRHVFNKPDKRPPVGVSDAFSGLVLVPLLILFVCWIRIGVNLKNMPFSLSTLVFHGGLIAIFALFVCFWLKLDMFQTLKYLLGLGLVTFLSGHSLLSKLAAKRQALK